jgi:hypothetical protein
MRVSDLENMAKFLDIEIIPKLDIMRIHAQAEIFR